MLRTPFASERVQRIDPRNGIKVIQLTSYPLPAGHCQYDWPSITPDNQRVVVYCQRWTQRDAPWDFFRVDTDGLKLYQLTEHGDRHETEGGYYGRPHGILTLDGEYLYVIWGRTLHRIEVETGKDELIVDFSSLAPEGDVATPHLHAATNRMFISVTDDKAPVVSVDLGTGDCTSLDLDNRVVGLFQESGRLLVQTGTSDWTTEVNDKGVRCVVNRGDTSRGTVDQDGRNPRDFCPWIFAHATVLGNTEVYQGCGKITDRCIWVAEEGKEPYKLVEGPYFWHSGASYDGEWIAADTNWPDNGIQLIHVPTGHFRRLCSAGATQAHYEFGHPHPHVSQDGRVVVFRSDRAGLPQIYAAHVTDEFRESIIAGELDQPNDKWM